MTVIKLKSRRPATQTYEHDELEKNYTNCPLYYFTLATMLNLATSGVTGANSM